MKLFHNNLFTIHHEFPHWSHIGFKIKSSDDRVIDIKPLHIRQPTEKGKQTIFMSAEIRLNDLPKVTSENNIVIPKQESEELFASLRIYANLISVAHVCEVNISGPTPSDGFIYESEDEKKFLEGTNGFDETSSLGVNFS